MSWSFSLKTEVKCPHCKETLTEQQLEDIDDKQRSSLDVNYTSNVGEMFCLAFDRWTEDGIRYLHGRTGEFCLHALKDAHAYFVANKEELEKLNPDNGWGSYEGAFRLLKTLLTAAEENPNSTFQIF